MAKLRRILMATTLTFSLATVSFAGTMIGSRSNTAGSRTGTMIGSRTGTMIGSRTGTMIGSRTGTMIGSRADAVISNDQQRAATTFYEDVLSQMMIFVLSWSW